MDGRITIYGRAEPKQDEGLAEPPLEAIPADYWKLWTVSSLSLLCTSIETRRRDRQRGFESGAFQDSAVLKPQIQTGEEAASGASCHGMNAIVHKARIAKGGKIATRHHALLMPMRPKIAANGTIHAA